MESREAWALIPEFDTYLVSDRGKIYSGISNKMLKQLKHSNGYKSIALRRDGKTYQRLVHRLVALAWIPNPDNLPEVAHIDGTRINNVVDNLRWDTRSGNIKDMVGHGTIIRGSKVHCAKLTEADVVNIRNKWSTGKHTQSSLGREFGVDPNTIYNVVNLKTWKWVK